MRDGRWDCQNNRVLWFSPTSTEASGCSHKYHNFPVYRQLSSLSHRMLISITTLLITGKLQRRFTDDFAEDYYICNDIKARYT